MMRCYAMRTHAVPASRTGMGSRARHRPPHGALCPCRRRHLQAAPLCIQAQLPRRDGCVRGRILVCLSRLLTEVPTAVLPLVHCTAGCSEQCPGWVLIPSCSASDALASSSRVSQLTPARLRIDRHATGHRGREWSLPRSNANKPSLPAHTRAHAQCLTSAVQISRHPFAEQSLRPASPARRECPISPARPLLELPCVPPCPVR